MTKRIITLVFDDEQDITLQLRTIKDTTAEDNVREFCTQVLGEIQCAQVEVEQEFNQTLEEMDDMITALKTAMSNLYFNSRSK